MSTHNIPFLNIKKKIILNYPKSATMMRDEFETDMVNEPSVFEPLKFCCIWNFSSNITTLVSLRLTW